MNSEYIQALIARIAAGQNEISDFPLIIQEKIQEKLVELGVKIEGDEPNTT
jgi:hypothetical protein